MTPCKQPIRVPTVMNSRLTWGREIAGMFAGVVASETICFVHQPPLSSTQLDRSEAGSDRAGVYDLDGQSEKQTRSEPVPECSICSRLLLAAVRYAPP